MGTGEFDGTGEPELFRTHMSRAEKYAADPKRRIRPKCIEGAPADSFHCLAGILDAHRRTAVRE
jgi:hypothetical protein